MCNPANNRGEPEPLTERFGGGCLTDEPMDNRFNPVDLAPRDRAYVVSREAGATGLDVTSWDLLGRGVAHPITNVRHSKRWQPRLDKLAG